MMLISKKKDKEVASVSICIILVWLKCSGKMVTRGFYAVAELDTGPSQKLHLKVSNILGSRYGFKCRPVGFICQFHHIFKSSHLKCQPDVWIPKSIISQLWPQVELIQHSSMFWCFLKGTLANSITDLHGWNYSFWPAVR